MAEMHLTWVDLAVAVILITSIGLAVYRGFVRETLSIFAWAAAAFATLYFARYLAPFLTSHMSTALAQVAAYAAVFLVVLTLLLFVGARVSRRVQESPIGILDRTLGAVFGVLRGLAVIAVLYILYSLVVPIPAQAKWMSRARTISLIQTSASALLALLPDRDAQYLSGYIEQTPTTTPAEASNHRKTDHKGYGADDRRALNRLIQATGTVDR